MRVVEEPPIFEQPCCQILQLEVPTSTFKLPVTLLPIPKQTSFARHELDLIRTDPDEALCAMDLQGDELDDNDEHEPVSTSTLKLPVALLPISLHELSPTHEPYLIETDPDEAFFAMDLHASTPRHEPVQREYDSDVFQSVHSS